MMFWMSDGKGNRRSTTPRGDGGVLLNLPRTRPQRSSARRVAARKAATGEGAATGARPRRLDLTAAAPSLTVAGGTAAEGAARKPTRTRTAAGRRAKSAVKLRGSSLPARDPAPRQGFESENESMSGSVHPPGSAELLAAAAEVVGELAKAGFSTGERVLKDALSRLPHS
jgi:hypothetical protein